MISLENFQVKSVQSINTSRSRFVRRSWSINNKFRIGRNIYPSISDVHRTKKLTGKGAKVCILDTGINTSHILLKDKIVSTKSFIDYETVEDKNGHGSHTAGIIAGHSPTLPYVDICVAPDAELYIGKVLDNNGNGTTDSVCKGIYWAIENEVDVINMSLGYLGELSTEMKDAIDMAIYNNIIVCVAAGNEGPKPLTINAPGVYVKCITIGALDRRGQVANFSSRGSQIDLLAPGVDILSCYKGGDTLAFMSGTSMATPFIAGVAALYVEYRNRLIEENKTEIDLTDTPIEEGCTGMDGQTGCTGEADPINYDEEENRLCPYELSLCHEFEEWCKMNCVDLGKIGFDNITGYGRLNLKF